MFQLPFYYVGLGAFSFSWLVGFVVFVDWIAGFLGRRLEFRNLTREDVRNAIVWQIGVLVLVVVCFKWVVLTGGPGIVVDRVLSGSEGSNWVAFPAAAAVLALVVLGGCKIWWRLMKGLFRAKRN